MVVFYDLKTMNCEIIIKLKNKKNIYILEGTPFKNIVAETILKYIPPTFVKVFGLMAWQTSNSYKFFALC